MIPRLVEAKTDSVLQRQSSPGELAIENSKSGMGNPRTSALHRNRVSFLTCFNQHAGHVVVLGSGADEEVEIGHHTMQEFVRSSGGSGL